jgi:diaminopimelate decarboxylase
MKNDLTIYVSGLYSGTNPQPGVGLSRALRQAYPNSRLVGVEYSNRCSGIHWPDFDDIWLQRPWTELDLGLHAKTIKHRLDDGALWISSIDLEILWLAEVFPDGHPNLLTPSLDALEQVQKPAIPAHNGLPVKIPEFVTTELTDWELHAFCRAHDWKVWLKGPFYEAVRTPTWTDLEYWRKVLSFAWATEVLFLQTHVTGYEESIMLSAYEGELLDCVHMRKRDLTELGKTWAGDALPVDRKLLEPLKAIIRNLNWTGGAELEMARDAADDRWLLEWNPRFPAWVHGSTIAGRNLPGSLVEGATGIPMAVDETNTVEFTRVVIEVPVRSEFPLSSLPEPLGGGIGHSMKHPSGLTEFAQRRRDETDGNDVAEPVNAPNKDVVPASYISDLNQVDVARLQTPASLFFANTAREIFSAAVEMGRSSKSGIVPIHAYSIKTNPDERLIRLALESGFLAEAISPLEVRKAVEDGFTTDKVVLNGPAKWWRRELLPNGKLHAIFCDSIDELRRLIAELDRGDLDSEVVGIRLRTPNIPSRFGIPIDGPELFVLLVDVIRELPRSVTFGIHFHMASSNVGVKRWRHLFESMLRWCGTIEALSNRVVECLDIGGGWFPEDIHRHESPIYSEILETIPSYLSGVTELISEPGKALAQPSMAVAMSVLEVRNYLGKYSEVVMDGSIAELPMHFFHPHRILSQNPQGEWEALARGDSMLLGRLCMEHDIVALNVQLPKETKAGDVFVFCDAGAYDRSMSYVFGCG